MIDYMYTGKYDDWPAEANQPANVQREDHACVPDPIVFHATMASLADMYIVAGMKRFAEIRFDCALQEMTNACRLLDSVPGIYALKAKSCTTFRKGIVSRVRWLAARGSDSDNILTHVEAVMNKVPEFAVDVATSVLRAPVLGYCSACGYDRTVSVLPLQCRCQRCSRGGALTLKDRFEYETRGLE